MRSMTAKDAKNRFGELLMEAQREPVTIEKNGKPVAVVRSYEDDQEIERMKLEALQLLLLEADEDVAAGRVIDWDRSIVDAIHDRGQDQPEPENKSPRDAA